MAFRAVKGMNDILPEEVQRWQHAEAVFREVVARHGFAEVRTPIVESTALFVRSIGENTDVVDKEMYTFERHQDSLTLRPEGTAGVVRAYVERAVHAKEPVTRWYYIGPMFRAERPQRGRYRQFYQAGCEIYGDKGPSADAEMIAMLVDYFQSLGISGLEVKDQQPGWVEQPAAVSRCADRVLSSHRQSIERSCSGALTGQSIANLGFERSTRPRGGGRCAVDSRLSG